MTDQSNNQTPPPQAAANPGSTNPGSTNPISSSLKQVVQYLIKAAPGGYILLFGVILPLITLGIEWYFHLCGDAVFDPIPSFWHGLLIACVPAANAWVWIDLYKKRYQKWLVWFNGLAMGIAGFYAILFIPLTPIGFITSWLGIGLLPLSPLLAFIACVIGHFKLKKLAVQQETNRVPRIRWGVLTSLAILVLLQLPLTVTNFALRLAASPNASTQQSGIEWLRSVGNRETMLRACYVRSGRSMDMISFLMGFWEAPISPVKARTVYYRVTGEPFNNVAQPDLLNRNRNRWFGGAWDDQLGSDSVGGKVKDLWLTSSLLDGSVSSDSNVAYLEWTLVFNNQSQRNAEARAHIELPTDAVVSRVTLWVNGEEREAAFAGRSQTRQAYQQVVSARRDPVLVTTAGKDSVMMQMFPVPPDGKMKVRIGITVPLQWVGDTQPILRLPHIKESNFLLAEELKHEVWMESKTPIGFNQINKDVPALSNGYYRLKHAITSEKLEDPSGYIIVEPNHALKPVVTVDTKSRETRLIRQSVAKTQYQFNRLVLVVDASASMKAVKQELLDVLNKIPVKTELLGIIAGDTVEEMATGDFGSGQFKAFIDTLEANQFKGGRDNVPALQQAWDLAAQQPNTAILWVHGPQPVELQSAENLRHNWERDPDGPLLFDLQVVKGRNHIMEKLDGIPEVKKVSRRGPFINDFAHWLAVLGSGKPVFKYHWQTYHTKETPPADQQGSSHIVRLWAYDEIMRLLAQRKPEARNKAIELATTYQLVTPVSGAVVLETQAQYERAGLEPVEPGSVPTIPEPETWAMLAIALIILVAVVRRQHRFKVSTI